MRLVPRPSLRPITVFCAFAAAACVALGAQSARADALVVPVDHSTRLQIAGSAQSVVVGNPSVADVTVVDSHNLFVSGRGYGVTDVVVLDGAGRTIYANEIVVGLAHTGRVSVWRGAERTDMACAPNCQVSIRTGGAGAGAAGGAPSGGGAAPPTPNPAGAAPTPGSVE